MAQNDKKGTAQAKASVPAAKKEAKPAPIKRTNANGKSASKPTAEKSSKPKSSAKPKEAASATKETKEQLSPSLQLEVRGIIILFLGILYTYCVVSGSDALIVRLIADTSLHLFGKVGRLLLEFAVLLHAVLVLFDFKAFSERRGAAFIYIVTFSLMILTTLGDTLLQKYQLNSAQFYVQLWNTETNGGIIGGVFAKLFKSLLSVGGTYILLILLMLLSFVFIFRQSIAELIAQNAKIAKVKTKEYAARREEKREEKREQAQERSLEAERLMRTELHGGTDCVPEVRYSSDYTPFLTPSEHSGAAAAEKPAPKPQAEPSINEYVQNPFVKKKTTVPQDSPRRTLYESAQNEPTPKGEPIHSEADEISFYGSVFDEAEPPEVAAPIPAPDLAAVSPIVPLYDAKASAQSDSAPTNRAAIAESVLEPVPSTKAIYEASPLAPENEATTHKEVSAVKEISPHIPYEKPPFSLLNSPAAPNSKAQKQEILATAAHLEQTLATFSIDAKVSAVSIGPTVTRFELKLQPGVRVSKVVNLSDDIALALAARQVRIEAPIPGKSAIGVEVPNREAATVWLSSLLQTDEFRESKSCLSVALGKLLSGDPLIMDITKMPHLLIAGQTGSGKSVCINTIIMSILYHSSPEDVKMILVDPKMVELNVYNDIPHLLIPVVTDVKQASGALNWAVREMSGRYEALADNKVRDIGSYNKKMEAEGKEKMHHIIIIIDELNDLMMSGAQAVEASICRLAQLARAAGIHLVLATQRPSVNVITGLIKANIPSRISFAVASQVDSRTILDMGGAEKLLGKGDMLYYPTGYSQPVRAQCAFISDDEVERVVEFIKLKTEASYDNDVYEDIQSVKEDGSLPAVGGFDDELLPKAMEVAFEKMIISTSTIQRRLRLGYARAGRIIDEMEDRGFVSPADGTKPRSVLIGRDEFAQILRETSK